MIVTPENTMTWEMMAVMLSGVFYFFTEVQKPGFAFAFDFKLEIDEIGMVGRGFIVPNLFPY